jgi:hypothetical protein
MVMKVRMEYSGGDFTASNVGLETCVGILRDVVAGAIPLHGQSVERVVVEFDAATQDDPAKVLQERLSSANRLLDRIYNAANDGEGDAHRRLVEIMERINGYRSINGERPEGGR